MDPKHGHAPGQAPPGYQQQAPPGQGYGPPPGQGYGPPPGQGYGPPPGQGYGPPPGQGYGQPGQQMQMPQQGYAGGPHPPMPPGQQPQQQQQQAWMARPESIAHCPPGLEYLTQIDQLLVQQMIELMEVFTNWQCCNRFKVNNSLGQQVYFAQEESDDCNRQCCGANRGFVMHVTDNLGQEVIKCTREFKCCAGVNCCACSDGCAMEVEVEAPPGTIVGYVRQEQSCLEPNFTIRNAQHDIIYRVVGPVCQCQGPCCTADQEYPMFKADSDEQVGKISKQWTGYVQEMYTNANNFGISFPMELDVKMKAVMIGAVFLIDFMYFERTQQRRR